MAIEQDGKFLKAVNKRKWGISEPEKELTKHEKIDKLGAAKRNFIDSGFSISQLFDTDHYEIEPEEIVLRVYAKEYDTTELTVLFDIIAQALAHLTKKVASAEYNSETHECKIVFG